MNGIELLNQLLSGPAMVAGVLLTGAVLTFKTGFVQVKRLGFAFSHIASQIGKGPAQKDGITPFQAVSTALSGTLGTGNIVGVAAAIIVGGAGSLVWMWVSAFLGMATKYAEIVLAMRYRKKCKGGYEGGAMYYIKSATGSKALAAFFAVMCVLASFGVGNMTQANTAAAAISALFSPSEQGLKLIFIVLAIVVGIILLGGISRIAKITSLVTPFMALFYIACCLFVIAANAERIIPAFSVIFKAAFTFKSAAGGLLGYGVARAMRVGFARGLFTNEAGLGSAPIAHAAANSELPALQGLWGVFEVFLDTIVMCTLTGLALIVSGEPCGDISQSATWVLRAFRGTLGSFASYAVGISTILFAVSTIISWSYYGTVAIRYLTKSKRVLLLYRICYTAAVYIGAVSSVSMIWGAADLCNSLMMIPNLIAVIMLSGVVKEETQRLNLYLTTRRVKPQKRE